MLIIFQTSPSLTFLNMFVQFRIQSFYLSTAFVSYNCYCSKISHSVCKNCTLSAQIIFHTKCVDLIQLFKEAQYSVCVQVRPMSNHPLSARNIPFTVVILMLFRDMDFKRFYTSPIHRWFQPLMTKCNNRNLVHSDHFEVGCLDGLVTCFVML